VFGAEDGGEGFGVNGEALFEVGDPELVLFVDESEFAAFEGAAVMVAEDREEDFLVESRVTGVPVDVEGGGEPGAMAVAKEISPPMVMGMADAHVVGDDIEEQAEVKSFEGAGEVLECGESAEFGVEAVGVADVIAVGAARAREKEWGGVEMADTEVGEVGGESCRVVESKAVMKLEAVGGAGEEGRMGHGEMGGR
jgi:hypothetical protein